MTNDKAPVSQSAEPEQIAAEVSQEFKQRLAEIMERPICLITGRPIEDWAFEHLQRKVK